ncbi:MAG: permease [Chloroflexi bacterium B3_Chlor]|nr:MAG: permease [Chloroflexi bacterium B3_Chlor]
MNRKHKGSRRMDTTTLVLVAVAAILLAIAFWQGRDLPLAGLQAAGRTLWRNLPMLLASFVIAGVVQVLIPRDLITGWLGTQAGSKGVLIGCVVGGLVPGAPYAVFPIVAALYEAGAGLGAVVSFVSAWSLWSVSRLPLEMALIDPKPALVRYAITFVVPPIAGLLAQAIARLL